MCESALPTGGTSQLQVHARGSRPAGGSTCPETVVLSTKTQTAGFCLREKGKRPVEYLVPTLQCDTSVFSDLGGWDCSFPGQAEPRVQRLALVRVYVTLPHTSQSSCPSLHLRSLVGYSPLTSPLTPSVAYGVHSRAVRPDVCPG